MSKFPAILNPTEEDLKMLLAAQSHIGTKNSNNAMNSYIFKRRVDGRIFLLNFLRVQWHHPCALFLHAKKNSQSGSACVLPIFESPQIKSLENQNKVKNQKLPLNHLPISL